MASDKQIEANRKNALLSTGPRSLSGKIRSKTNAFKHGLAATQSLMPGEDSREFAGMRNGMFNELKPKGDLEFQLVERMASLVWRLRRVNAFEVALMRWAAHLQFMMHDAQIDEIELQNVERRNDTAADDDVDDIRSSLLTGRALESLLLDEHLTKLSYYETRIQNQLSSTIKDFNGLKLARLQQAQLARPAENPAKADNDEYIKINGRWMKKLGPP